MCPEASSVDKGIIAILVVRVRTTGRMFLFGLKSGVDPGSIVRSSDTHIMEGQETTVTSFRSLVSPILSPEANRTDTP